MRSNLACLTVAVLLVVRLGNTGSVAASDRQNVTTARCVVDVNTSGRAGGLECEPLKADCLGAACGGGQSNIFIWSSRRSSCSCRWMYSRITFSSRPTVDTRYPRAQKCSPVKFLCLPPAVRAI